MLTAVEDGNLRGDLRMPQLDQHVLRIAQCRQTVSVFGQVLPNCLRCLAFVGIHQPETDSVRILLADLLYDRGVAARNRAVSPQKYQHNDFAGAGSERIHRVTIKIHGALLRPAKATTSHAQRDHERQSIPEFNPQHRSVRVQNCIGFYERPAGVSIPSPCHPMPCLLPYNGLSMIAHLRGKLLAKHPNQAIVETSGVGYDVVISVPTFSDLPGTGAEVALYIHTHVREDQIALYGFLRPSEKLLFEKLITVSGIGPKLAITILSGMAADEMVGAIRGNDVVRLTRIPGIGKKTAERMVLELRDKLPEAGPAVAPTVSALSATEEDVLSALVNLGYQRAAAEKALAIVAKSGKGGSFDAMFRESLATLSK